MSKNENIIMNFKTYDMFLSSLNAREKEIALSIKMMYAIHMENNKEKGIMFDIIQIVRLFLKIVTIPFLKYIIKSNKSHCSYLILGDTATEQFVSKKLPVSKAVIAIKISFNKKALQIYKEFFQMIRRYNKSSNLNKHYIILLLHRLIDYLIVYHTVDVKKIEIICIENDRDPKNLALIHISKLANIKTIKYDNWLIDPVNHNDIYCDIYFYPSIYHKNIIEQFPANKKLKYIKGGFLAWDKLANYTHTPDVRKNTVIYFTQFGIDFSQHKQYIEDILMMLQHRGQSYELIIKVHPREESDMYYMIAKQTSFVRVVKQYKDIYELISKSTFCFSVFSTISLEAKHIINHSYFINYNYRNFSLVDYEQIGLDLVKSKEMLNEIFSGYYTPIDKKTFLRKNNCSYPYTLEKLRKVLKYDKS
jgi:hypothetical protein